MKGGLSMNYKQRLALLMALDSMMIVFIVFIAFWIAYSYSLHVYDRTDMIVMAVALLIFHHIFAIIYKLYNKVWRSEEHTSELQSRFEFVCRLLLEEKKIK